MIDFRSASLTTENGVVVDLSGEVALVSLDGVGVVPVRRLHKRAPLANSLFDAGYRLDARRMTMTLLVHGKNVVDADRVRDSLAMALAPTANPLTLSVTRNDGETRLIDCYLDGDLDFPSSKRFAATHEVVVPLVAPDPVWYAAAEKSQSRALTGSGAIGPFITTTDMSWIDHPVIEITGEIPDAFTLFRNPGSGSGGSSSHVLEFRVGIPSGETWVVDTRPGRWALYRKSDGANRMGAVRHGIGFAHYFMCPPRLIPTIDPNFISATQTIIFTANLASGSYGAGASLNVIWRPRHLSL